MPQFRRGEVWTVDLGIAGKVRPALILSDPPQGEELALATLVPHTTALRDVRWEVSVPKPFLQREGAFHVQQVVSVPTARLERRLGRLDAAELERVRAELADWIGM
jgi:mRNA interferase MazF